MNGPGRHPRDGSPPPEGTPHDLFAVDIPAALEALAAEWGSTYIIGHVNDQWRASRRDGTGNPITAQTPDDLAVRMRADWPQ